MIRSHKQTWFSTLAASAAAIGLMAGAPSAANAAPASLAVGDTSLGQVLIAENGHTLYMFAKDSKNKSTCYDACAEAWPALLSDGKPIAAVGVDAKLLGTATRKDGKKQVTYKGWPLYFFAADAAPGETKGQGIGDVWFAISPKGQGIGRVTQAKIGLFRTPLGQVLAGEDNFTLYMFTKDANGESACYDACAQVWPALLTNGAPLASRGVDAKLLGTITRTDGKQQVTYNGMPLYYFAPDTKAGETKGQGSRDVWYVLAAKGQPIGMKPANAGDVAIAKTKIGDAVAGKNGMTLYVFMNDANGESACYDGCAAAWPPLVIENAPAAGAGIDAKLLGTITRKDGKKQATFNGRPVYFFASDGAAGDANGHKVGGVWFAVGATGDGLP